MYIPSLPLLLLLPHNLLLPCMQEGVLWMEAMKPPFYPLHRQLKDQLRDDPIGDIRFVRAGSSLTNVDPAHPSFKLETGGGALLNIGVYGAWLSTERRWERLHPYR
jgi:hypothetical protein